MAAHDLRFKLQAFWKRLLHSLIQPRRLAVVEACAIGLVSALAAILLEYGVGRLGSLRIALSEHFPAIWVLPAIGLAGGLLSGWIVERFAPETSGSGMTEVKAVLGGISIPLDLRVAWFKLIGAILVLASGIPLGREGPTVQIGAALSAQLSRWVPTSPDYRRQLIAAGAGAGLAAAFNAPIAGVLFVVEELLQDISGITLGTAILASFIAAVVTRVLGSHSLDLDLTLVRSVTSFSAPEIPFYILLGILAGLLGAIFNRGVLTSIRAYRHLGRYSLPIRVGLAGLICGITVALLPPIFHDNAGLRQVLLTGQADFQLIAVAFVVHFFLVIVASGSGAPGGLLVPTLVLGAAIGFLVGDWEHHVLGLSVATTYARVGMGAFFGAVARVPITAIILVFEMTTDFNLVLPLMITSAVAWIVGEKVLPGSLYDHLLELKGIHLDQEQSTEGLWTALTAADVMQRKVETLSSQMTMEETLRAFSQSSHRSFPVVAAGKLVGMVTQKDLARLPKLADPASQTVAEIMTPEPIAASPGDSLAHILHLLNRHNLNSLPVAERRRLVGIITRSDIIRAEAAHLDGALEQVSPSPSPSQVVYQTRAPETGQKRLLLPLSNPKTAPQLLQLAIGIARQQNCELECLHVIVIPRHLVPAETAVRTTAGQRLLRQAAQQGQAWQVPVHTQIRVAHDLSEAILQTVKDRHIDLVLMGWKGSTTTPDRIFSRVVDTMIRQAPCEVVLAKLSDNSQFDRWLVPTAGGPNAAEAIKLLPALTKLGRSPNITLYRVYRTEESQSDQPMLEKAVSWLQSRPETAGLNIQTVPVHAESVVDSVLEYAEADHSDVIMIGASREGLLQQVVQGNIPALISRKSRCSVILVRGVAF